MSDPRLDSIETIIHRLGIVSSKTALSSHHYMYWKARHGSLTEEQERYALHVSHMTDRLSDAVAVFPNLRLPGSPTVLASRHMYPTADREFVQRHLSGLSVLGTVAQRRDLLEVPTPDALRAYLPSGFTISPFPQRFHDRTRDIAVTGPNRQMFDIELRNRRTHIHDVVSPPDREALSAAHAVGRRTVMVVPQSTIRFRTVVASYGGVTIDTNMYVVATEATADLVTENGWACWPVETAEHGIPRVADMTARAILGYYEGDALPQTNPQGDPPRQALSTRTATEEISRLLRDHGPARARSSSLERVGKAIELWHQEVSTQKQAAAEIKCSPSTLSNDFRKAGVSSPWRHGGRRPNAGRKPRESSSPQSPSPPTA